MSEQHSDKPSDYVPWDLEAVKQEICDLFARYGSGNYMPTEEEKGIIDTGLDEILTMPPVAQSGDVAPAAVTAAIERMLGYPDGSYMRCPFCGGKSRSMHKDDCAILIVAAALRAPSAGVASVVAHPDKDADLFLCCGDGEGTHEFKVCRGYEGVAAFYESMCGRDQDDTLDSLKSAFDDPEEWRNDGTALKLELYCARFYVWKVTADEIAMPGKPVSAIAPTVVLAQKLNELDAARYRFIRSEASHDINGVWAKISDNGCNDTKMDKAIDAAMAKTGTTKNATDRGAER